ncbi:hypothetical protein OJAV_G00056170 [Oryzias javanicus]|uniref:Uncharacterized protein n=1 Tax=Oryzias javanicus TaxID=123683 RepID=A0A3S2MQE0_ORYJA|nr:hypothetical protein OJAV_G00056170 [Oryzias javanicus]
MCFPEGELYQSLPDCAYARGLSASGRALRAGPLFLVLKRRLQQDARCVQVRHGHPKTTKNDIYFKQEEGSPPPTTGGRHIQRNGLPSSINRVKEEQRISLNQNGLMPSHENRRTSVFAPPQRF